MHAMRNFFVFMFVFAVASIAAAGNGNMGGDEILPVEESDDGEGGIPIEEPGTDMTTGSLYGDLFVILRYTGDESKRVPAVDENGEPVMELVDWLDESGDPVCYDENGNPCKIEQQAWDEGIPAVGGEPRLTENFVLYIIVDEETGEYIVNPLTGDIYYPAPYPSQCVQPVADFDRWGDISAETGLPDNRLPLIMTYDATWERTECEVVPDIFIAAGETWNGVTYYTDIYYTDLIQEVSFGRLNLGRAPDSVLDHAFDEAVRAINNAENIVLDASGRLLLTTKVYDEFITDEEGNPILLETVTKAIDSPLENMALYVKLMKDGHLITPAVERTPIDRSVLGGIPLWKYLELEDGPSQALRPTIDIAKVESFGLGHLVDASNVNTYYTYVDAEGDFVVQLEPCTGDIVCEEWTGIVEQAENDVAAGDDFPFSASFLAAGADKTGEFNIDKIVYFNSIMGINKVAGYSAYDVEGDPLPDAVDYSKNPVYFDFGQNMNQYKRQETFTNPNRGQVVTQPYEDDSGYHPAEYDGNVRLLVQQPDPDTWVETVLPIFATIFGGEVYPPINEETLGENITGFTRMADDDLRVIEYTHTYQIPGLR